jgi:leader peptidase (prepilin peptidase)/N-methyltransferase
MSDLLGDWASLAFLFRPSPFSSNLLMDDVTVSLLLFWIFLLGTIVGSLLNVCIYRMPLEKSLLWPGSRCGHCLQPIRWYDNIPLLSYVFLRGRCHTCGAKFSARYFLIELLTGLCFAGLFWLEVIENVHEMDALKGQMGLIQRHFFPSWQAWIVFGFHAILLCFLIVASFTDLDYREIPLAVTIPGTIVGLIGAVIWAWPWPAVQALPQGMPAGQAWWQLNFNVAPKQGLYPWPFWAPLPAWFEPGSWKTGLATGLLGAVVGTLMLRTVRFLFSLGLGLEALGLGDADLMMMAGGFLGWQPVVVAFFVGVFAGLFFGIAQLLSRGENMLPFGPALAIGIVATFLCWTWIAPRVQLLFFNLPFILGLAIVSSLLMLTSSYVLRVLRH